MFLAMHEYEIKSNSDQMDANLLYYKEECSTEKYCDKCQNLRIMNKNPSMEVDVHMIVIYILKKTLIFKHLVNLSLMLNLI